MRDATSIAGVAVLPRSALGRRLINIRARRRRAELDAALAWGADPWSAPELMARAARLGSLAERRKIAGRLHRLVAVATLHRRISSILGVRDRVVVEQRDSLIALAERLFQPAPVDVAVVAQLERLLSDWSSLGNAYQGDPGSLAELLQRVWEHLPSD